MIFERFTSALRSLFRRRKPLHPAADEALAMFFTDNEKILHAMEALVGGTGPKRLFFLHGSGGVGKSSLLRMFRLHCRRQHVPVALVSGDQARSAVDVLRRINQDLGDAGVALPRFRRKLQEYDNVQAKVQENLNDFIRKSAALARPVAASAAPLVPAAGGVAAAAISVLGSDAFSQWLAGILTKADTELLLRPEERLTGAFLDDMNDLDQRPVVILVDTYEQIPALNDWFCDFARDLPRTTCLVIAGRTTPMSDIALAWNDRWPSLAVEADWDELRPLEDEHIRLLVTRYYRSIGSGDPDPRQTEKIVRFARGLPLVVTTVVNLSKWRGSLFDLDEVKPNVIRHLVDDMIMKDVGDDMRAVLAAAATFRRFNQESLASVIDPPKVAAVYRELERFPFVRGSADGLALHDSIRDLIAEYVHLHTPQHAANLHRKAAAYYQHLLATRDRDGRMTVEERQYLGGEIIYHLYHAAPAEGAALLRETFESAFARRSVIFCRKLLEDARGFVRDERTGDWLTYFEGLVAIYTEGARPREILETLLAKQTLDRDLRANVMEQLATILWFYSLREESATARAEQLYQECLRLWCAEPQDYPGQSRALIWLGVLHQRINGKGEPYFRRALDLGPQLGPHFQTLTARAERELSIALRMQGRFSDALTLIRSSVATFETLGMLSEAASSVLNEGMLLALMGQLDEADERFDKSGRLLDRVGQSRVYERVWLLHGAGDVALRRGDFAKARERFRAAAKEWQGDRFGTAIIQGALAQLDLEEGAIESSVAHAQAAIALQREVQDAFGLGWTLCTLGNALAAKGDHAAAKLAFEEALRQMRAYGSAYGAARVMLGMGQLDEVAICGYEDLVARALVRRGTARAREGMLEEAAADFAHAVSAARRFNKDFLNGVVRDIVAGLRECSDPMILGARVVELLRAEEGGGDPPIDGLLMMLER